MQNQKNPPLVAATMPALARELEDLLVKAGRPELSAQVPELRIVDRCRCGDDFCATFYTRPRPHGSYGANVRCLALGPTDGMLILDLDNDVIVCVEVLFRDEVREALHTVLP